MASDIRSASVEIAVEPDRRLDLFNGTDLSGWSVDDAFDNPDGPPLFRVENGCLVTTKDTYGHLVSDRSYRNYLLEIEYRLPETAVSFSMCPSCVR